MPPSYNRPFRSTIATTRYNSAYGIPRDRRGTRRSRQCTTEEQSKPQTFLSLPLERNHTLASTANRIDPPSRPCYPRAAIVVYDITSFESFEGAKSWVRELKLYGQPNVVVALAANKCDLEQYRAVSTHEGQAYARENELTYVETSAKSAHNVRHMFVELGKHAPPSKPSKPSAEPTEPTNAPSVPSAAPSAAAPDSLSLFACAIAAQRVPRKDASAMTSNTSLENGQHKGGGCAC